ncbi:glycosyltransferase family 2 protein [Acidobacteriota bacterium]
MFNKKIVVYIPCHDCEKFILEILQKIPHEFHHQMECLVLDNFSSDNLSEIIKKEIKNKTFSFKINLIRTKKDIGYSGSQKLAYSLISKSENVKYVIMLHGDGQYDPFLLRQFLPYIESKNHFAVVNGFRDKIHFPEKDETPFFTYIIIKTLNFIENIITGFKQKEWHSGFVLYSKDFLTKIPLQYLTKTRHIDGEMLILAGVLNEKTASFSLYKKYKDYESFSGLPKLKYVLDVFKIFLKFKNGFYHQLLGNKIRSKIDFEFDRL